MTQPTPSVVLALNALERLQNGGPLAEPALGYKFISQGPFAEIAAYVTRIAKHLWQAKEFPWENALVVSAPVLMGPRAAKQRRTRWRADRMRYIRALKNDRLRREPVQIWRVHAARIFTDNCVRAKLIWKKHQQVWFARKFRGLCAEAGGKRKTDRAEGGGADEFSA